jgi:VCBS repeat-containing protein
MPTASSARPQQRGRRHGRHRHRLRERLRRSRHRRRHRRRQDVTGASAANPVVITTTKGILSVSGYDAATGKITYTYQETGGADDHTAGDDSVQDHFTVTVTDVAGKSTSNDLVIQIIDTAPVARTTPLPSRKTQLPHRAATS